MTATAGDRKQRILLALIVAMSALWVAALILVLSAYAPVAKDGPDVACVMQAPNDLGFSASHSPESVVADGRWVMLPLGLECTYSVPASGETAQTQPNPIPTAAVAAALAATAATIVTAVISRKRHHTTGKSHQ